VDLYFECFPARKKPFLLFVPLGLEEAKKLARAYSRRKRFGVVAILSRVGTCDLNSTPLAEFKDGKEVRIRKAEKYVS